MQSCGRWLERSKKELVEAALGRLVFGQDEAGTDMPNSAQKFGQINRKSHRKIFSFPSPSVKHNNASPDVHGSNRPDVVGTQDRAAATILHCVVYCLDTGIPASSLRY